MPRLSLADAGLLSPKTLRNEIVEETNQMESIQPGQSNEYASANSTFPAVNLDAPEESYFVIGGGVAPMTPTAYASESPIGALGDISERDITTDGYKRKLAPEKEVDAKLNNPNQILSLYNWAARQLRTSLFLTREQVSWRGDAVTDGLIGVDGNTPHPDLPSANALDPATSYDDYAGSKPYQDLTHASYLLDQTDQGMMDANVSAEPTMYVSPSVWRDIKRNEDMQGRFTGVEVQGISGQQVRSLLDEEIPNIRKVRVRVPRRNDAGEFLDANGNTVDDIDDAEMDNVLEPYDPSADAGAGANRRNIVVGKPGQRSAFIPFFTENMGDFNEGSAPQMAGGFGVDRNRGFWTQTWMGQDPAVTWLKAVQDIGFHLELNEHWAVIKNV